MVPLAQSAQKGTIHMMKLSLMAATLLLVPSTAFAADMPVMPIKAPQAIVYPYDTSGIYFGIGSLVTGQKPTIDGSTQAGVTSLGGSLGGLIGYRWGGKTGFAISVDGAAYWNNLGGTSACGTAGGVTSCSIESRFSAMQRVGLEVDTALLMSLFPTFNLPNMPAAPVISNISITGHKTKVFFAALEDDVSAQIVGLGIGKAWTFAPGVGVATDWNLGNGSVVETWAAYFNPTQGFAIGPVPARAGVGPIYKVGLNWKI